MTNILTDPSANRAAQLEKLREPFPDGTVGKLPKVTCPDCSKKQCSRHQRSKCQECGAYISSAHVHLDFVGHAAVTDRLLTVDPLWDWEPFAVDQAGLPALDRDGNLWIRLTVCGKTRVGVGDGPNMKERVGDAIRNASMRFGVALSLWTKDELESGYLEHKPDHAGEEAAQPQPSPQPRRERESTVRKAPVAQNAPRADAATGEIAPEQPSTSDRATGPQVKAIFALAKKKGMGGGEVPFAGQTVGREVDSLEGLTKREASQVIEALNEFDVDAAATYVARAFSSEAEPF